MDPLSCATVCIIGAGPYGLSIAAHLRAMRINFRIFGISMQRWRAQMPMGMFLKSEGCASSLSEPTGLHTLGRYCAAEGLPYGEWGKPISREVLVRYASSFQRNLVPNVEDSRVVMVRKAPGMFHLELSDGQMVSSEIVVVATGLEHMAHTPPELAGLPAELRSHSAEHYDLRRFKGKDVTVIGGGQSALETAALLHEKGASVRLLVRKPSLTWNQAPSAVPRSFYQRLRYPRTNLGDGLQLSLYANAPGVFHHLPRRVRVDRTKVVLGPAGAWWLKERIAGQVPIFLGHSVVESEARGSRAALHVCDHDRRSRELVTDHVIAATGYRYQLQQLPFLSEDLKSRLRQEQRAPMLSANFESSVAGLYFAGLASSYSFGPAMRFIHGASYTARCISNRIAARRRRSGLVLDVQVAGPTKCQEFSGLYALSAGEKSEARG
jgi:cation diffusion facilitator CzcD-associated flavoprotein CzcO